MMWEPTHFSVHDGSPAMEVNLHPAGLYLANENGDYWQADPAEWRTADQMHECVHCGRWLVLVDGVLIDPYATGDDAMWRETCDENHEDRTAPHEVA